MPTLTNIESLPYFVPETALAALGIVVVLSDLLARGKGRTFVGVLSLACLAAVGGLSLAPHGGELLFYGMVRHDAFAQFFKVLITGCSFLTVLVSLRTREVGDSVRGEFFALVLFVTFGMFLMASASNLLMVYLGIEMASIGSYILVGFLTGQARSSEAAFKYVVFGAVASGVMLFGVSLLYGMAGTADLHGLAPGLVGAPRVALLVALVFVFAGLGYKIASVPFHMWSPDVYEGSPIPIAAFLSVASKAAGFAVLVRFFRDGLGAHALVEALDWPFFLALVAAVTMTVGNLAALGQSNVKRLLAYSSIAHGGYMLMGVSAMGATVAGAVEAVLFYLIVYLFMNLGAFYVVLHLADPSRIGSEEIADYRGLVRRAPLLSVLLTVFLVSLIGIPPFAGFWGKLYLFKAVLDASLAPGGVNGHNLVWLVLLGLLNSAISLYYYFSVVKAMLLDRGEDESPIRANPAFSALLVGALAIPTLVLGFVVTADQPWLRASAEAPAAARSADTETPSALSVDRRP
jgi:NADH-quinone oxidoreductase subunit N